MQKGIVVFIFANYLDDVLVWNYAMSGFKRGIEKVGMGSVPACICVLNSLKFRLLPKNCPREWRVGWRFLHAYAGLLVHATMIALFACRRLKQNGNGGANADNNKSWPKSLIVSDYSRILYYKLDPPKNWVRSNHYHDKQHLSYRKHNTVLGANTLSKS